ncbi:MAG: hypothetical protein ABSG88_11930 [Bradyrhizobium sp.]
MRQAVRLALNAADRVHPLIDRNVVYPMIPPGGMAMAGGGTTLKTLGIFTALIAGAIFVNYGTLSPCDALRETVRRQDGLARILPDALITAAIEANAGPLTPMKCVGLLLNKQSTAVASAPAPVAPPPQASFSQPPRDPMVIAQSEMVAAITECRNKRIDGTLKTFVASAQCSNPRIVQAFSKANYRYMDLIAAFNAQRLQISERVDRKQLSEADAQIETQKLFASIVEAEKQRDSIRK